MLAGIEGSHPVRHRTKRNAVISLGWAGCIYPAIQEFLMKQTMTASSVALAIFVAMALLNPASSWAQSNSAPPTTATSKESAVAVDKEKVTADKAAIQKDKSNLKADKAKLKEDEKKERRDAAKERSQKK